MKQKIPKGKKIPKRKKKVKVRNALMFNIV